MKWKDFVEEILVALTTLVLSICSVVGFAGVLFAATLYFGWPVGLAWMYSICSGVFLYPFLFLYFNKQIEVMERCKK